MTVNEFTHNEDFEDFNGNESIIFSYNHDWEILDIDYRCKSMDHLHLSLSLDRIDCKNLYEYLNNINEFNNSKNKNITKPLKDFTADELKNICNHNTCNTCPLMFLRVGCTLGTKCPISRKTNSIKNDNKFYENYFISIDKNITVKESDLKDG